MTSVIRNKRRPDEVDLKFDVPALVAPPAGVEWFFDNQFVPGADCAEDPWLDLETELKHYAFPRTSTWSNVQVFDPTVVVDAPILRIAPLKEEPRAELPIEPTSLSSSSSLSNSVLRTCHHCKTVRSCQPCVCTRTFCDRCIEKYPTIPQAPDPSGIRPQCPHCQELCGCARCRQRRAEESAPAKSRAQRSTPLVKRQHSEEDEEHTAAAPAVKQERLEPPILLGSHKVSTMVPDELMDEAVKLGNDDFDSWRADDISLSPLAASSSSSSCALRTKFVVSDDISCLTSARRTQSMGNIFDDLDMTAHRPAPSQSLFHCSDRAMAAVLQTAPAIAAASSSELIEPELPAARSIKEDEDDEQQYEEEDDEEDYRKAPKEVASDESEQRPAKVAPAPRPKKSRRVAEKPVKPRGSQGRKASLDTASASSPTSERSSSPVCKECGTRTTPLWRAGPDGTKSLCNRCGIRYMRQGAPQRNNRC